MLTSKENELWKQIVCPACNGEGHFEGLGCSSCFGSGWWVKPKEAMQLIRSREAEARIDEHEQIRREAATYAHEHADEMNVCDEMQTLEHNIARKMGVVLDAARKARRDKLQSQPTMKDKEE